jgi:hypothetical protein
MDNRCKCFGINHFLWLSNTVFDNQFRYSEFFTDDDPIASLYKEIGTQFGGNDMGMIVLESDNVFKLKYYSILNKLPIA